MVGGKFSIKMFKNLPIGGLNLSSPVGGSANGTDKNDLTLRCKKTKPNEVNEYLPINLLDSNPRIFPLLVWIVTGILD
jgi:hypothetical protein